MYRLIFFFCFLQLLAACNLQNESQKAQKDKNLTSYVNPFIGTGGHGHTFPGATQPFGMVQLSPDTRLEGWDGCSGYHYSDSHIYGFSHTHLSGTGVSDYGDILLMPTNTIQFHNGADGKPGYRAPFQHKNETASPGYYRVLLDSTQIQVELTTTHRTGYHKYSFPIAENQFLVLDLEHRDKVLNAAIEKVNNFEVKGYRFSEAWAKDQRIFFHMKFSHPIQGEMIRSDKPFHKNKAIFQFNNPNNEPVYIKVGISAVDTEGAKKNLETEIGDKSFEIIKAEAEKTWEKQLEKIVIETNSKDDKVNFYTSLYHTMIAPNLYQDVDGRYRGMDLEIHQADFDYYTVFSLWDTYRAAHPLYTIIEQERTNDFIKTMLAKYDEGGIIPIWDLSANYTGCMIGYHGIPVIADAYLKEIDDYDTEKAFAAMKYSATRKHLGLASYQNLGFIPVEEESESVSKTLEYAYDDWTIAQMAKAMGKIADYQNYITRAQSYKNLYNPETGFLQGRFRNTWFSPFDPFEVNFNYTEANAWQYSLYAPQDLSGLMNLMGGKDKLEAHLDQLFTVTSTTSGRDQADITGLIGQYAHGNEPSHHMAYLYNFVNKPFKTQEKVRQILTQLYSNTPEGISGNEDCGQMSAWYIFSSLGFYPVTPGTNEYIIGTPLFDKASIELENGNSFTITAENNSKENKYVQSVTLNGKLLSRSYLFHNEIMSGGILHFKMGPKPGEWGSKKGQEPKTEITENEITLSPFISKGTIAFKDQTKVTLKTVQKDATIYFKVNDSEFQEYKEPLEILERTNLVCYAIRNGIASKSLETQFYKIDPNRSIQLKTTYANQYSGGGDNALIDGIKGARDFRTGAWQGYQNTNLEAIVDLGSVMPIDSIKINFLQDQRSWIFFPTEVQCYVSDNGRNFYKKLPEHKINAGEPSEEIKIKTTRFSMNGYRARYIKIVANNFGDLPEWHLGYPYKGKAWIFVDEIEITEPGN